ncbi:MAG: anti-sigma factor, partial [Chloroflexota bacterium]|nr:anti-sigma factor [Chloroflexota bacterium]
SSTSSYEHNQPVLALRWTDRDEQPEPAADIEPAPAPPPQQIRRRSPAVMVWAAAALILLAVSAGLVLWNLMLLQDQQAGEDDVETIAVNVDIASPPAEVGADLTYLEDRGVFLLAVRSLPQLAENQVFQVWLIGEGNPVSVATFSEETAEVAVAADRTRYAALAVSVEPGPVGSPSPTTSPIIVADISQGAS